MIHASKEEHHTKYHAIFGDSSGTRDSGGQYLCCVVWMNVLGFWARFHLPDHIK